jgi:hypothetical protein
MSNEQAQLKFCNGAIDWLAGIECRADQLRDVLNKAEAAGFKARRVQAIGGRYRIQFERQPKLPSATNDAPRAKHSVTAGHEAAREGERVWFPPA